MSKGWQTDRQADRVTITMSKGWGQVSLSTSDVDVPSVARGSVFSSVLEPDDRGTTWTEQLQKNWKFRKVSDYHGFCKDRVRRLYDIRAGLAERQKLLNARIEQEQERLKAKIQYAVASQVKAECVMESCLYPTLPEITDEDLKPFIGLNLPALEAAAFNGPLTDLLDSFQPYSTIPDSTPAADPAAWTVYSTTYPVYSTTYSLASSSAGPAVVRSRSTLLPIRGSEFTSAVATGFSAAGFAATNNRSTNRPTKPRKKLLIKPIRPACRKPSMKAKWRASMKAPAPFATGEDDYPDLLASTSG